MKRTTCLVVFLLLLVCTPFCRAQFETSAVLGFVRDSSGAPVVGSKVTLVNTATNVAVVATTDGEGQFLFPDVHVGTYKVSATASGFSDSVTDSFRVDVSTRQRVDVTLKPRSVAETVTVSGAATQLESETSSSGTVISETQVEDLPLNGRAYADLMSLAPGVRRNTLENQTVTSRDASYNVNGERSEFNNFLLDGLDNNAYGTSNQGFSNQAIPPTPDAINEFRAETNNYSAESGNKETGNSSLQNDRYPCQRESHRAAAFMPVASQSSCNRAYYSSYEPAVLFLMHAREHRLRADGGHPSVDRLSVFTNLNLPVNLKRSQNY